jgi:hypothetical protein
MSLMVGVVMAQEAGADKSPAKFKGPINVFILAGQSNMEGQGSVDHDDGPNGGNFSVADLYRIYTGKMSAAPNILDEEEVTALGEALKAEDVKRRRNEAETILKEHPDASKALQK